MNPARKDQTSDLVAASKVVNKVAIRKQNSYTTRKPLELNCVVFITYPSVSFTVLEITVQSLSPPLDWELHEES